MEPLHSRRYAKRQHKLSAYERGRRLAKIVPYAVFDGGECWAVKRKHPSTAYLHDTAPTDEFLGWCATDKHAILDDDESAAFVTRSYLTMHTFGHPASDHVRNRGPAAGGALQRLR